LRELIPSQAERYAEHGFVEIDSTLSPGRRYRIHRGCPTDIYEGGAPHGLSCLQLHDGWLPPTDRVIAEYFLIQGDERSYLETANILGWEEPPAATELSAQSTVIAVASRRTPLPCEPSID